METDRIATRLVPTEQLVLVCAKCTRKLKGGFGRKRKHSLRSELREAAKLIGRRAALRVVETGCLGLCPKHAVTVASGLRPGELLAVPTGTEAATVLERVGLPPVR